MKVVAGAWTPALEDECRALWKRGWSASQIGGELGFSRSAICAKARRLKLAMRKDPSYRRTQKAAGPKRHHKLAVHTAPALALPVEPVIDTSIPLNQRRSLIQLDNNHCHWPVGDPRDPGFFFCGADATATYCPAHRMRAGRMYKRPSP